MDLTITIKDEEKKLGDAIAALNSVLAGLSNRQAKQALASVAIKYDQRLVSVHAPVGAVGSFAEESFRGRDNREKKKIVKTIKTQPRALWREDAEWVAAERRRAELVTIVKSDAARLGELKQFETEMKALRETLRAKYEGASGNR